MTVHTMIATPAWSLRNDENVLAGAIVIRDETRVDARLLLNGAVVYESRHSSREIAEGELAALRRQCARDGWIEPAQTDAN
jgi:hypothetical protein